MSGPDNQFQELAADAARRIEGDRAMAQQLSMLPAPPGDGDGADGGAEGGRKGRGPGKASSQLRQWLASRGFRMPEDVLAEIAGLTTNDDAVTAALAKMERIMAALLAGAEAQPGMAAPRQSLGARMDVFKMVYAAQIRALEAVMPYVAPKVTPDTGAQVTVTQLVVAGGGAGGAGGGSGAADRAARAIDVTPQARRIAPPPMPHEMQRNQQLSNSPDRAADGNGRTE